MFYLFFGYCWFFIFYILYFLYLDLLSFSRASLFKLRQRRKPQPSRSGAS